MQEKALEYNFYAARAPKWGYDNEASLAGLEVYTTWQKFEFKKANPLRMLFAVLSARFRRKTSLRK